MTPGGLLLKRSGLELSRWFLALNLALAGWDFLALSPWFGRWSGGFTPTEEAWAAGGFPGLVWVFPAFWHLPGWLIPALLIVTALGSIEAGIRKSRIEPWLSAISLYLYL